MPAGFCLNEPEAGPDPDGKERYVFLGVGRVTEFWSSIEKYVIDKSGYDVYVVNMHSDFNDVLLLSNVSYGGRASVRCIKNADKPLILIPEPVLLP